MQVADQDLDLTVEVDHDADPVDVDAAVARFLLALVRKQAARSAGTAATVAVVHPISAGTTERQSV